MTTTTAQEYPMTEHSSTAVADRPVVARGPAGTIGKGSPGRNLRRAHRADRGWRDQPLRAFALTQNRVKRGDRWVPADARPLRTLAVDAPR